MLPFRSRLLRLVGGALLCGVLTGGCGSVLDADEPPGPPDLRPNLILLVADDLRTDALGAYGNPVTRTPVLDRLAAEGARFDDAIVPFPTCTPSRAELLSGVRGFRNGVTAFNTAIDPSLPLLPEVLRDAGYHTWYVGKWHNDGTPTERGYERAERVVGGMGDHFMVFVENNLPAYGYSSALFADAATDLIDAHDARRPFFLHVNFTAPHDPRQVPAGYEDAYAPADVPLPGNFLPEHPFDNNEMAGNRDEGLLPTPRSPEALRQEIARYYAMVSHLDEQVGRIRETLEARGLAENTYIVFISDHGLALGSHGLLGKHNLYDVSLLTPMLVWGPRVEAGLESDALVYLRDLYPTLTTLASVPVPPTVDARSLVPVLEGRQRAVRSYAYAYVHETQRAVRSNRWKFITYPRSGREQLFDLLEDPEETTDLAANPAYADTLAVLRDRLRTWQRTAGDPIAPAE